MYQCRFLVSVVLLYFSHMPFTLISTHIISDPCADAICPEPKICITNFQGNAKCLCPDERDCPVAAHTVCGSDGKTYLNECVMKAKACAKEAVVYVVMDGDCGKQMLFGGGRGSLMVSVLDFGSSGPGSSPGRGTALCSWARHFTLTVPLYAHKWVWASLRLGVTVRWTSIPCGSLGVGGWGSINIPSRFMLRKPG